MLQFRQWKKIKKNLASINQSTYKFLFHDNQSFTLELYWELIANNNNTFFSFSKIIKSSVLRFCFYFVYSLNQLKLKTKEIEWKIGNTWWQIIDKNNHFPWLYDQKVLLKFMSYQLTHVFFVSIFFLQFFFLHFQDYCLQYL